MALDENRSLKARSARSLLPKLSYRARRRALATRVTFEPWRHNRAVIWPAGGLQRFVGDFVNGQGFLVGSVQVIGLVVHGKDSLSAKSGF
jgi:hypothetical protein